MSADADGLLFVRIPASSSSAGSIETGCALSWPESCGAPARCTSAARGPCEHQQIYAERPLATTHTLHLALTPQHPALAAALATLLTAKALAAVAHLLSKGPRLDDKHRRSIMRKQVGRII